MLSSFIQRDAAIILIVNGVHGVVAAEAAPAVAAVGDLVPLLHVVHLQDFSIKVTPADMQDLKPCVC